MINEISYELRVISSTKCIGATKWQGETFCRHGGDYHCAWWKTKRSNGFPIHAPNGSLDSFNFINMNVAICVKK